MIAIIAVSIMCGGESMADSSPSKIYTSWCNCYDVKITSGGLYGIRDYAVQCNENSFLVAVKLGEDKNYSGGHVYANAKCCYICIQYNEKLSK
jgi:hypothetical protein